MKNVKLEPLDPFKKSVSAFRSSRQLENFESYENKIQKIRGQNNGSFFNKRNEIKENKYLKNVYSGDFTFQT